jgi:hypothetical protein
MKEKKKAELAQRRLKKKKGKKKDEQRWNECTYTLEGRLELTLTRSGVLATKTWATRTILTALTTGLELALKSSGDNLLRETKILTEVLDTSVGQEPVVVAPVEGGSDETLGGQGLHQLHNIQVGDVDLGMNAKGVLACNANTLYIH